MNRLAVVAALLVLSWVVPAGAAPGDPPTVDNIVRIYVGGWTADSNGNGTCGDDPTATYVAAPGSQGRFRHEANGRRITAAGRYDLTVVVWAVDHTGTEMTRWNYEVHYPGPTGNSELFQGDQHYKVAWGTSQRPAPGQPVTWFFYLRLQRAPGGELVSESTCSVQVVAP